MGLPLVYLWRYSGGHLDISSQDERWYKQKDNQGQNSCRYFSLVASQLNGATLRSSLLVYPARLQDYGGSVHLCCCSPSTLFTSNPKFSALQCLRYSRLVFCTHLPGIFSFFFLHFFFYFVWGGHDAPATDPVQGGMLIFCNSTEGGPHATALSCSQGKHDASPCLPCPPSLPL